MGVLVVVHTASFEVYDDILTSIALHRFLVNVVNNINNYFVSTFNFFLFKNRIASAMRNSKLSIFLKIICIGNYLQIPFTECHQVLIIYADIIYLLVCPTSTTRYVTREMAEVVLEYNGSYHMTILETESIS